VRDQYTTITNPKSLFDLFELGGRPSNYGGVRELATRVSRSIPSRRPGARSK